MPVIFDDPFELLTTQVLPAASAFVSSRWSHYIAGLDRVSLNFQYKKNPGNPGVNNKLTYRVVWTNDKLKVREYLETLNVAPPTISPPLVITDFEIAYFTGPPLDVTGFPHGFVREHRNPGGMLYLRVDVAEASTGDPAHPGICGVLMSGIGT